MIASTKGGRKVNHRVIEQAPGKRHVLRNGAPSVRRIVPGTMHADQNR
jgi:hypothetical protein